jgi:hypothetical protein
MIQAIGIAMDVEGRHALVTGEALAHRMFAIRAQAGDLSALDVGDQTTGGFAYPAKRANRFLGSLGSRHG